jgi:endonuclease-3
MQASCELRARALVVHERLCAEYGCPIPYFHDLDPLSELVSSLLSHRTKNRDSGRAFQQLRERFATWEAVRDAPVAPVQEAISPATWPEQKAPRIQQIPAGNYDHSLRPSVAGLPERSAGTRGARLAGVANRGRAENQCGRAAFQPLALIPENISVGPAHRLLEAQLPPDWTAQQVYENHEGLMLHGQRCCYFRSPDCHRCAVLDLCPYGQRHMVARKAG